MVALDPQRLPYFAQFLRGEATCKASSTVRNHRMALARFDRWLSSRNGATAADATPLVLDAYACELRETYPLSANAHLSALRVYTRWLRAMGLRRDDPSHALQFVAPRSKPIQSLTTEDLAALVRFAQQSERRRFGVARTAYLVCFLADTGLRIGEALALQGGPGFGDLGQVNASLSIWASKTRTTRVVPISPSLRPLLLAYLDRRAAHFARRGIADAGFLWPGEHGGRWSVSGAAQSCRTVGRLARLQRQRLADPQARRHVEQVDDGAVAEREQLAAMQADRPLADDGRLRPGLGEEGAHLVGGQDARQAPGRLAALSSLAAHSFTSG